MVATLPVLDGQSTDIQLGQTRVGILFATGYRSGAAFQTNSRSCPGLFSKHIVTGWHCLPADILAWHALSLISGTSLWEPAGSDLLGPFAGFIRAELGIRRF